MKYTPAGIRIADIHAEHVRPYIKASDVSNATQRHRLRHSCASWMVMQGVPLSVVQHVLGHSDIQVTQRYAHLAPDVMMKAMKETFGNGRR